MKDTLLPKRIANYTRMVDGTQEDFLIQQELRKSLNLAIPDLVLKELTRLQDDFPANLISRYDHSLQTATRALRDEADEETVVASLLHDIGDSLAPNNHSALAVEILRPFVTPSTCWMIKHHAIFQGYYFWHHLELDPNTREKFRGHPDYERTVDFCYKWDQESFDPNYDTLPLSVFEPMVRRIFAREPWGEHTKL